MKHYLLFLGTIILLLSACKKDPCKDKVCLNGGACIDGTCLCTNGYTGTNCETPPDACAGVSCLNDGYCANGSCVCPTGYTGADCSQYVTPSSMRINSIIVTSFPATDGSGGGWDLTSGADLYPVVAIGSTTLSSFSSNYITNANPSLDHQYTPPSPIVLSSPTSQYTINLYDHDDIDADDWMGGVYFTPYISTNGFPSTLILAPSGGSTSFQLEVSYVW